MCIKESMRLHTPVPFIERQTTKDMDIDGYFLPSGTVVDIQLYVLHHNAHVWEEPMVRYKRLGIKGNIRESLVVLFEMFVELYSS